MRKTSILASLAGLGIAAMSFGALAQEDAAEAPKPLSDVWIMVVKPGMDEDFNSAMTTHMQFRKDAGESREWQAYRVAVGHNMKPIAFRSCCFDWADLDAHEAENDELGLGAHFQETVGQYVDHFHHYLETFDWENSHWPDEGTSGPYYGVTSWTNKQGRDSDSSDAKAKMSRLAIDEGYADDDNNWLWMSRIGGDAMTMIVSSFDNYADMAPDEQSFAEWAAEKMGEEEADELFEDFGEGFEDSDYTIWVHDPELSTPSDDDDE